MTKLYHKDVYIPDGYDVPCWNGRLTYTKHAIRASTNDRYGYIDLPEKIDYNISVLIEVESTNGIVVKQVWRTPYDITKDLVLVITNEGMVKTVWINSNLDKHSTLDKTKYEKS